MSRTRMIVDVHANGEVSIFDGSTSELLCTAIYLVSDGKWDVVSIAQDVYDEGFTDDAYADGYADLGDLLKDLSNPDNEADDDDIDEWDEFDDDDIDEWDEFDEENDDYDEDGVADWDDDLNTD